MAGKKSIIDLLPAVGTDSEGSDFPFRFNRHAPGDYLVVGQQHGDAREQKEENLCQKLEKAEKPKQLVPPAGIPPPTAEELIKLKNSQPTSVVDYCKPVEYQFMPIEVPDSDLTDSTFPALTAIDQHWDHTGVEDSEFHAGAEGVAFPNEPSRYNSNSMPRLKGMHAPCCECAHILPPAGFLLPFPSDVFRFNRVVPYYPPDLCIRPNEGDLTCPPRRPSPPVNHPCMPAAGTDTRMLSDAFRFHKVFPSTDCNPCKHSHPISCACKAGRAPCPCANKPRYPPSKPARHFDFRYPSGATECNSSTHRHGHVPQECHMMYPDADEIAYHDTPQLGDCAVCPPRGCSCQRCSALASTQCHEHPSHGHKTTRHGVSGPCCNLSSGLGASHSSVSAASRCMSDSMYNNMSATASRVGQGDCQSKRAPNPYAITGNLHYNSQGYATDKTCTQLPVQRADKVADFSAPCPHCPHPYYPSNYICRPVYNRKYLLDCPEQDGPPADTYTFL